MKYKCDKCGKNVEWIGDGRCDKLPKEKTGQQYIEIEWWKNSGYKYKDGVLYYKGKKTWTSNLFTMPRVYLCHNCAIKNNYIKN